MKAGLSGSKEKLCHGMSRKSLLHLIAGESLFLSSVRGDPAFLKLSAEIGWKALRDSVALMGNGKFTELVWPLQAEDPDDAFSSIPYEKVPDDDSLIFSSPLSPPRDSTSSTILSRLLGPSPLKNSPRTTSTLTSSVAYRAVSSRITSLVSLLGTQRWMH
jgi:hypothetical protein